MTSFIQRETKIPTHPAIVGTVGTLQALQRLGQLDGVTDCDFLEYRLDAYGLDAPELAPLMEARPNTPPPILTVRDPEEGGLNGLDRNRRLALYDAFLDQAALVDLEIRNLEAATNLVERAKAARIPVIGSFHNFETTPDPHTLTEVLRRGVDHGADLVKFAVTIDSIESLFVFTRFFLHHRDKSPLSAMGMGALGKTSRLLLAQAGSRLNYAYLHEANAPGQWAARDLRRLFDEIIPQCAPSPAEEPA